MTFTHFGSTTETVSRRHVIVPRPHDNHQSSNTDLEQPPLGKRVVRRLGRLELRVARAQLRAVGAVHLDRLLPCLFRGARARQPGRAPTRATDAHGRDWFCIACFSLSRECRFGERYFCLVTRRRGLVERGAAPSPNRRTNGFVVVANDPARPNPTTPTTPRRPVSALPPWSRPSRPRRACGRSRARAARRAGFASWCTAPSRSRAARARGPSRPTEHRECGASRVWNTREWCGA